MFLTHCMIGWIVLIALSLCLPVWNATKVTQTYRVVSTSGVAQIQCVIHPQSLKYQYPEEARVTVLKGLHGNQELCSSILNFTDHRETRMVQKGEVQCTAETTRDTVEVTLSGLNATDTDMYRCEIQIFYPPPYLRLTGNGTLIHVLDSVSCPVQETQRQIHHQGEEEEDDEEADNMAPVSVPVVVLVIAIICVLSIIIYFQTVQCERGKREIFRLGPGMLHKVDDASFPCENIVCNM
ncbi:cytotoxic T-lymphocyte protein 4 [Archocentrus centrarchus]|uniref:cytotoxic T-lymphocyte protein 4 n=1 Tax=Archocentrus centrarchus TaxID=63155 RepID=UPI0011EA130E|nr:cytotoxic T-lymphocyte protein 4-like [Archocentrus centrarchus]